MAACGVSFERAASTAAAADGRPRRSIPALQEFWGSPFPGCSLLLIPRAPLGHHFIYLCTYVGYARHRLRPAPVHTAWSLLVTPPCSLARSQARSNLLVGTRGRRRRTRAMGRARKRSSATYCRGRHGPTTMSADTHVARLTCGCSCCLPSPPVIIYCCGRPGGFAELCASLVAAGEFQRSQ